MKSNDSDFFPNNFLSTIRQTDFGKGGFLENLKINLGGGKHFFAKAYQAVYILDHP